MISPTEADIGRKVWVCEVWGRAEEMTGIIVSYNNLWVYVRCKGMAEPASKAFHRDHLYWNGSVVKVKD